MYAEVREKNKATTNSKVVKRNIAKALSCENKVYFNALFDQ